MYVLILAIWFNGHISLSQGEYSSLETCQDAFKLFLQEAAKNKSLIETPYVFGSCAKK